MKASCARKETVEINTLTTSRNGDRKIIQAVRTKSELPMRKRKWNQFNQIICQYKTYRTDLAWSHFTINQDLKTSYNCSNRSPTYPFLHLIQHIKAANGITSQNMTTVFHAWPNNRLIEIKYIIRRMNQCNLI